jgi:hypothetical protein
MPTTSPPPTPVGEAIGEEGDRPWRYTYRKLLATKGGSYPALYICLI